MTAIQEIRADQTDYHVHCNADGCGHKEMTIENICSEAVAAGLREICILKHYSAEMPIGGPAWYNWKRTEPEALTAFLDMVAATPIPDGLRVLTGVETELIDTDGAINIPLAQQQQVDVVLVSAHWLPVSPLLPAEWKRLQKYPCALPEAEQAQWRQMIRDVDPRLYVQELAAAYAQAMAVNPRLRVLAHMGDGLGILKAYLVPVDQIKDDELLALMHPVMDACVRHQVLWELTPGGNGSEAILQEAKRRGVQFSATVDAHFLYTDGWGHKLRDHHLAEAQVRAFGLPRGRVGVRVR